MGKLPTEGTLRTSEYLRMEFLTNTLEHGAIRQQDGWTLDDLIDLALDTRDEKWFKSLSLNKMWGGIYFII